MDRIIGIAKQYRYGILVLLIGLGLMLLPAGDSEETVTEAPPAAQATVEERIAAILSKMEGVGKAEVLLTVAAGEETVYETSEDSTSAETSQSLRREPVIITNADRDEQGLIRQTFPPIYQGAIIVCQGGDSPAVKLAVVEAVCDVTGLTADRITVLKMK